MKAYVDPKADSAFAPTLQAMIARGEVFKAECHRRRRRFLPRQVMRPVWLKAGLVDGVMLRSRPDDFFSMTL